MGFIPKYKKDQMSGNGWRNLFFTTKVKNAVIILKDFEKLYNKLKFCSPMFFVRLLYNYKLGQNWKCDIKCLNILFMYFLLNKLDFEIYIFLLFVKFLGKYQNLNI